MINFNTSCRTTCISKLVIKLSDQLYCTAVAFTQNDTCLGKVVILYINCSTVSELKCKHEQQRAQLVCELQQFLKSETGFTHVNNLKIGASKQLFGKDGKAMYSRW